MRDKNDRLRGVRSYTRNFHVVEFLDNLVNVACACR